MPCWVSTPSDRQSHLAGGYKVNFHVVVAMTHCTLPSEKLLYRMVFCQLTRLLSGYCVSISQQQ